MHSRRKENIRLVIMLFITNLMGVLDNFLPEIVGVLDASVLHGGSKIIIYSIILLDISVIIVFLIKKILPEYIGRVVLYALIISSMVISILDIFLMIEYGEFIDQAKLEIIMSSDSNTVREFLNMYVLNFNVAIGLIVGLIIIILMRDIVENAIGYFYTKHINYRNIFVVVFAIGIVVLARSMTMHGLEEVKLVLFYRSNEVMRVIWDMKSAYQSLGDENKIYSNMEENADEIIDDKSDIPYVIFVLGESNDRNRMHVYGYELSNTPFIDKRRENNEIAVYTDTISCGNATTDVMSKLFTYTTKEDSKHDWSNMIDIFKNAGYKTAWISNQSPVGRYGNMDKIFSDRCDYRFFTAYDGGNNDTSIKALDGELLPALDAYLDDTNRLNKNFIVLHLMGTHEQFKLRYSKEYDKFSALDEVGENDEWRKVMAEYDNAMLYNDYIIEQIIKRFEREDAVIVYASDHGMEIYDGRNFVGHSAEIHGNRHMIEIQLIVWMSDRFKEKHREIVKCIYKSVDKPFRTDDMIHYMLGLVGIKTVKYDRTRDPLNDAYDIDRNRVYNGSIYHK